MKTMKSTTLALATLAVLGISATVWATSTAHRPSLTYPTVTYGSRCGPAQAGSTWVNGTGGAMTGVTSLTIEQTEGEHNVRLPSASPMYYTGAEQGCRFTCLDGYDRDGGACTSSIGVSHDVGNGTITVSDGTHSYTIRDRNEGAIVAGTGKLINRYPGGTCTDSSNGGDCWDPSYGDYFQWGNTYGFANVGSLTTSPTLVPNASTYGPANPYTSSTFITQPGVASASKYDYWTGGQNDNLRGGAGDNGAIEGAGTDADRQGPCPAGFHVPSAGEWGGLLSTRWNATSGDLDSNVKADVYYDYNNGLPYFDYWQTDWSAENVIGTKLMNDFLLPLAGYRYYDSSATVNNQGFYAYYWSSSPNSTNARFMYFNPSNVFANNYNSRSNAFSLRCFQNSL